MGETDDSGSTKCDYESILVARAQRRRPEGVRAREASALETINDDARFRSLSYNGKTPSGALADTELYRNLYLDPISTASFAEVGGLSNVYRRDLRLQLREL